MDGGDGISDGMKPPIFHTLEEYNGIGNWTLSAANNTKQTEPNPASTDYGSSDFYLIHLFPHSMRAGRALRLHRQARQAAAPRSTSHHMVRLAVSVNKDAHSWHTITRREIGWDI